MNKQSSLLFSALAAAVITGVSSCGSDRVTGNEQGAHIEATDSTYRSNSRQYDTAVTGVPGNSNAVNAQGNAGNGSGMGSESSTEAKPKH